MFVLSLIIVQIIASSAKIINYPSNGNFDQDNGVLVAEGVTKTSETNFETWDDPLWVLKVNDRGMNFTFIRSASEAEEEQFDADIGPLIHRYPLLYVRYKRRQASKRVKKDNPNKPYPTDQIFKDANASGEKKSDEEINNAAINEIIKMINKFVLSYKNEPDSNLPDVVDVYDTPTLTLFFKGPFTTLMVNYERKQWQFFMTPPSPLPDWFYNEHSNRIFDKYGMYVKIPDVIKGEFYEKLLNVLTKFFTFPI